MKVNVSELIGEYGITLQDGQQVYDVIHPELLKGHIVELDFSGMEIFASPFFNAAFGQLVSDLSSEHLNRLLQIRNLVPDAARVLRRVIKNSQEYYQNRKLRTAVDNVIKEQAESR